MPDNSSASNGRKRSRPESDQHAHVQMNGSAKHHAHAQNGDRGSSRGQKKRFVWPQELHAAFVMAVFDHGLKTASPKTLLDLMPRDQHGEDSVNSEQVNRVVEHCLISLLPLLALGNHGLRATCALTATAKVTQALLWLLRPVGLICCRWLLVNNSSKCDSTLRNMITHCSPLRSCASVWSA